MWNENFTNLLSFQTIDREALSPALAEPTLRAEPTTAGG
jgi:hypothetical protein